MASTEFNLEVEYVLNNPEEVRQKYSLQNINTWLGDKTGISTVQDPIMVSATT